MKIQDVSSTIRTVPSATERDASAATTRRSAAEKSIDGDSAELRTSYSPGLMATGNATLEADNVSLNAARRSEILQKVSRGHYNTDEIGLQTAQKIKEFYR